MPGLEQLTRRAVLERGAAIALGGALVDPATALGHRHRHHHRRRGRWVIPLPSPAQVQRDFARMVRFGPRLTGSPGHNAYLAWLERELHKAGVALLPGDFYETDRWLAEDYALRVLEGPASGAVRVGAYYPRSLATPAGGVVGRLVYGGSAPAPSFSAAAGFGGLEAALSDYATQLTSWAQGSSGRLSAADLHGSILLVDVPMPPDLTTGAFLPIATYTHWSGHSEADWLTGDYKRAWVAPGVSGIPMGPYQQQGVAAVVFVLDISFQALAGAYIPFEGGYQPVPALFVDRDTGNRLRAAAAGKPLTRLTLTATRRRVTTRSIVGVLPGSSHEVIILNTHTDGQGFVEENCGVALVHLARHFGSLPRVKRLRRTLVFSLFSGHMTFDLPQTQGFIDKHAGIIKRAAAALTIEHFGCREWIDTPDRGYVQTGDPEAFGVWTTQGKMFEVVRDAVAVHDLPRTALLRPPVQFGVGGAFQTAGVPQLGAIAGPCYLLTISPHGDLDKLDPALAAKQIAWTADIIRRLDSIPASELRMGDPTLG